MGVPTKRTIAPGELASLARLARLALADAEVERFQRDLASILEYFDQLDDVQTDVKPLHHASGLVNVFREDTRGDSLPPEDALGNAAEKEEGYVRAPRIL
ncbi:MAG: Asp-tRNA(Asn)/Glu-tRNA(Gln) amidotransferase subunit GatC [Euryarchaeota archaeon]|nr:Asp-tRNA(Asn)/Glu-tRNA(Gln) amidotransferase subunit GatC [Euryarchaeota archaeon]